MDTKASLARRYSNFKYLEHIYIEKKWTQKPPSHAGIVMSTYRRHGCICIYIYISSGCGEYRYGVNGNIIGNEKGYRDWVSLSPVNIVTYMGTDMDIICISGYVCGTYRAKMVCNI